MFDALFIPAARPGVTWKVLCIGNSIKFFCLKCVKHKVALQKERYLKYKAIVNHCSMKGMDSFFSHY